MLKSKLATILDHFIAPKYHTPKILVLKLGLPPVFKGRCFDKIHPMFTPEFKEENFNFHQWMNNYANTVFSDKQLLSALSSEYQDRIFSYLKAAPHFTNGDQNILRDKELAAKEYQQGLMFYPYFYPARLNLGYLYRELRRLTLSEKLYRDGLHLVPDDFLFLTNLGRTLVELDQQTEAIKVFTKALAIKENDDFCLSMLEKLGELIRIYKDHTDPNSAILISKEQWEKIIETNLAEAQDIDTVSSMFSSSIRENRFALFIRLWENYNRKLYIEDTPTEHWHLFYGFYLRKNNRDDEARKAWLQAIDIFPNSPILHTNLGKLQQGKERLNTFEKAFKLGDRSDDTKVLFFETLTQLLGHDLTVARFVELYRQYGDFGFIRYNAYKLYPDDGIKAAEYMLTYLNEASEKEQIEWIGRIAGEFGQNHQANAVILLTQKYINQDVHDLSIHWNWIMAMAVTGNKTKGIEHIKYLLQQDWLTAPEKENLQSQIDYINNLK